MLGRRGYYAHQVWLIRTSLMCVAVTLCGYYAHPLLSLDSLLLTLCLLSLRYTVWIRVRFSSRAMRESHEHLKITESEWSAFCKDFDDTMAQFNVPEPDRGELAAIVQSTRADIVSH